MSDPEVTLHPMVHQHSYWVRLRTPTGTLGRTIGSVDARLYGSKFKWEAWGSRFIGTFPTRKSAVEAIVKGEHL